MSELDRLSEFVAGCYVNEFAIFELFKDAIHVGRRPPLRVPHFDYKTSLQGGACLCRKSQVFVCESIKGLDKRKEDREA